MKRWIVLEDWTRGKYPEHNGGVRPFAYCFTRWGAHRKANRLNRRFMAAIPDRLPNVYFRVKES